MTNVFRNPTSLGMEFHREIAWLYSKLEAYYAAWAAKSLEAYEFADKGAQSDDDPSGEGDHVDS